MTARNARRTDAIPAVSAIRRDDDIVLAGLALRPGTDLARLSRFGDDHWNLMPAFFRENALRSNADLDFAAITDPVQQLIAREFIYARLHERLPGSRACLAATAASGTLLMLKRFMAFVAAGAGRVDLAEIDQAMLDGYLAVLRAGGRRTAPAIANLLALPIDLHRYGKFLTGGGIRFEPWKGRPAFKVAGCVHAQENTTLRIPEPVMSAMLYWSLKYVDCFAGDILAAREELERLEARCAVMCTERSAQTNVALLVRQRLGARLEVLRALGRGLPVWSGGDRSHRTSPRINYPLLRLYAGCDNTVQITGSDPAMRLIIDALNELGPETGGIDTPISNDPDTGTPWRDRFDTSTLAHEEKMLQAACYVVCAYLSGMRDSEVQAMRTGCHIVERSADGMIERHRIRSVAYKWRGPRGAPEEWVTIAPVGRAVAVLERLASPAQRRRGLDTLWLVLKLWGKTKDHVSATIVRTLDEFRMHLDARYGLPSAPAIPYGPNGQPWRFTTRQFRRTIAWYIANRPFGTVAGKIQYKHASIAMFEGYAGTSASGFRQEVDRERALGQLDDIVEHYEDFRRGLKSTGPASARLFNEFERVQKNLDDFPGRIADQTRVRAMLGQLSRTLHVGYLNDCFFDPATALCLDRSGTADRSAPVLSHCTPDRCPNSCISHQHLPPWQASIAEADTLLANRRLPVLQRDVLIRDNERKRRLIAPLLAEKP